MVLYGIVIRLNHRKRAGLIRDTYGREFHFWASECEGDELPPLGSSVTFLRDPQYGKIRVAHLIRVDQLPSDPIERFLRRIGEE